MSHTILNPDGLHDPVPFGYSHTARLPPGAELVFVAGQYGSGPDGSVVSDDFAEQVRRAFDNVAVALGAHGLGLSDVVQLRTYVVDPDFDKLGAIARAVGACGDNPPPQTVIGVAGLAIPGILFEVEAVAARA
ncbi:MAG: RidA family protein [Thermoleophilia bacterium]|nr:RidA family protein [Thermoleophilia bacterium]